MRYFLSSFSGVLSVVRYFFSICPVSVAVPFSVHDKRSACLNSRILNIYTTGLKKELEKFKMFTTKITICGSDSPVIQIKMFMISKGSQVIKANMDTKSRVFVKRLLREALFCCCEVNLPCLEFIQIPMLQTHIMIVRHNWTMTTTYKADLNELKTPNKVRIEDRKTASIQSMKMVM